MQNQAIAYMGRALPKNTGKGKAQKHTSGSINQFFPTFILDPSIN